MHRALLLVDPPLDEPVTLDEAKVHLRVDGTDEDELIEALITAARQQVEADTGRALVAQTWEMRLADFPCGAIEPWHAPLASVISIITVDSAEQETTLDATVYQVEAPSGPHAQRGRITTAAGALWPTVDTDVDAPVRVLYEAGYGDGADVPKALTAAILLALGDLYANREAASVANITANPAYARLIAPFRLFWG